METIKLTIEYEGSDFCGWQRQPLRNSIQGIVEEIIAKTEGSKITVYGASRTDSGVHAEGQVAHFYSHGKIAAEKWRDVLNFSLPHTIRVLESKRVSDRFHAQKDAMSKVYEYRILNRPIASALDRRVYFYPKSLDWNAMRESMRYFVGEKDFRSFQASGADVKTTTRRVLSFDLFEDYSGLYRFRIEGTGFLKQMVRNIIGTIVEVGEGKIEPPEIDSIFASLNRNQAGRTVPAAGLTLNRISYAAS